MHSAVAWPGILGGIVGLGVLVLRVWAVRTKRQIAERDLCTLDAADDTLKRLGLIVATGERLLHVACVAPVSAELVQAVGRFRPELIQAVGRFRRGAEAAIEHAAARPRPDEAIRRLELDLSENLHAAEVAVSAVIRLHDRAASCEINELMHGEARRASAQFSELAAKMAEDRARIEARRVRLRPLATPKRPGWAPIFGWRPQASK
jgi:hypothetical protein